MSFEKKHGSDPLDILIDKIAKGANKNASSDVKDKNHNKDKKHSTNNSSQQDIKYDDVDFDGLDQATRKSYTDLFMGMPDIYKIIGVDINDDHEKIKRKCNEKLAKYHPDKISILLNNVEPAKQASEKKKLLMQYKLIREASTILKDITKKKYYDMHRKTIDGKNFAKQKASFDEFKKLQESETTEQSKSQALDMFKMKSIEMDKKTGFNRGDLMKAPMSKKNIDKKIQDLMLERETQDIEIPKNMFGTSEFNQTQFHKAWEKQQKKQNKSKGNTDRSIIAWDGIAAANDFGIDNATDYKSFDANFDDMYVESTKGGMFAQNLESDDESDMGSMSDTSIDVDYVQGHNQNRGNIMDKFKDYENARREMDDMFDKREFGDTTWKSVMENPMNISSQMGGLIGNETKQITSMKKKSSIDRDYADAYKQLVYE